MKFHFSTSFSEFYNYDNSVPPQKIVFHIKILTIINQNNKKKEKEFDVFSFSFSGQFKRNNFKCASKSIKLVIEEVSLRK